MSQTDLFHSSDSTAAIRVHTTDSREKYSRETVAGIQLLDEYPEREAKGYRRNRTNVT